MSGAHDDYAVEPIRGLPELLPPGEHIVWQGGPSWIVIAKNVFHIRAVAAYFVILMLWRGSVHAHGPGDLVAALGSALSLLPISILGLGLLSLLAWLCARTSVYTVTNRRVVMRVGVALPTAINIPLSAVDSAGLRLDAQGAGDIVLRLNANDRVPYSTLWPHVRPWHFNKPQPLMIGIPDAQRVAGLLGELLGVHSDPIATENISSGAGARRQRKVAAMAATLH